MSDTHEVIGAIRRACYAIVDYWDGSLDGPRVAGRVGGGSTSGEPPLPVSAVVLDDRRDAHTDLAHWARVILEVVVDGEGRRMTWRIPTDEQQQPPALAAFVAHWAERLTSLDRAEAELCAEELAAHADKLRHHALPDRRDWMPIGECPVTVADADGNPVPCGAKVRAYAERQFIACPGCGTEDTLAWWMSQIVPEGSDLAPADAVIACVTSRTFRPLTHEQIRQWASRGFIQRHGKDVKGRTLYSSAAVLAYVQTQAKEAEAV